MPFIVEFLRALVLGGQWSTLSSTQYGETILDAIEEPHKWRKEYAAWAALDRPSEIAFGYSHGRPTRVLLEDGWEGIYEALDREPEKALAAFDHDIYRQGLFSRR